MVCSFANTGSLAHTTDKVLKKPKVSGKMAAQPGSVRVLTPSYSMASLSNLVSPKTAHSPLTLTVNLADNPHSKKVKTRAQGMLAQAVLQPKGSTRSSKQKSSSLLKQHAGSHSQKSLLLALQRQEPLASATALRTLESKNPKFMRTIEEVTPHQNMRKATPTSTFPYMHQDRGGLHKYKSPSYKHKF